MSRWNTTPFAASTNILGAKWTSPRFDPPANQSGDIQPTVWSSDGSTYVLIDDGGVDVPQHGAFWRQSLARISGSPPSLRFQHVGDPSSPAPHTWSQIGGNPDNDQGPLGAYYSIGFAEAGGVLYATQQHDWDWTGNGLFTGLAGIAYSTDHGVTWRSPGKPFGAPLGNLAFVDGGAPGGRYPDGYLYAIGTEREFNASRLVLGRVQKGIDNVTDPGRWQWFAGLQTTKDRKRVPLWSGSLASATPVLSWDSHITYPQMTYDRPLHRYLLTFTHSYSSALPGVWTGGAELVILDSPIPWGPFGFVARSSNFGPSNGYGVGIPSQWISSDGRDMWLKWAANFKGCASGLDCSGKYGFNTARLHLTTRPSVTRGSLLTSGERRGRLRPATAHLVGVALSGGASLPLLLLAMGRRRRVRTRAAMRRNPRRAPAAP